MSPTRLILAKISQNEKVNMILRRTLHQACKEEIPSAPTIPLDLYSGIQHVTNTTNKTEPRKRQSGRCTKLPRKTTKTRQATTIRDSQHQRVDADGAFPFFELPREIRDQVYSYLVLRPTSTRSILDASTIARERKKRIAAATNRNRLNLKRTSCGKPPIRQRTSHTEPILELNLFLASQRLQSEASNLFYSANWFAVTLNHLPSLTAETPTGWDLSRVAKLQLELQIKDVARMNRYVDWSSFFATYSSLRLLRVVFTFHSRYYDWASTELQTWESTHFIHKAFFRDFLAALPNHVDSRLGPDSGGKNDEHVHGKLVNQEILRGLYGDFSTSSSCCRHMRDIEYVVS